MAGRLFGAESLPEAVLAYCRLDPQEQIAAKFESTCKTFNT